MAWLTSLEAGAQAWAWFQHALSGMASPGSMALALALTTLLLEDVAIAAGVALAAQGALSWGLSLGAVGGGIALGDLGLYAMGHAAHRIPRLQRHCHGPRTAAARQRIHQRLGSAVLLARVVPGLRLAMYTACGFLKVPWLNFAAWVLLAVTLWTGGLYAMAVLVGDVLSRSLGLPAPVAVALPILVLAVVPALLRRKRQTQAPASVSTSIRP